MFLKKRLKNLRTFRVVRIKINIRTSRGVNDDTCLATPKINLIKKGVTIIGMP